MGKVRPKNVSECLGPPFFSCYLLGSSRKHTLNLAFRDGTLPLDKV